MERVYTLQIEGHEINDMPVDGVVFSVQMQAVVRQANNQTPEIDSLHLERVFIVSNDDSFIPVDKETFAASAPALWKKLMATIDLKVLQLAKKTSLAVWSEVNYLE